MIVKSYTTIILYIVCYSLVLKNRVYNYVKVYWYFWNIFRLKKSQDIVVFGTLVV